MENRIIIVPIMLLFLLLSGCDAVNDKAADAVNTNNPSLCKELHSESEVQRCYGIVADEMNDPEICSQSADKNDCVTFFSMEKGNIKYCDMTTDAVAKYACVAQVTGDKSGRAIESLIADWRSNGAISKCKELCEPPYKTCMQGHWQTYQTELERCTGISDGSERYFCEQDAKKEMDRLSLGCYDEKDECEYGCMPKEE